MGQRDKAEKLFVGCPDVFAELCNVLLYDGAHVLSEDNVIPGPTESIYFARNEELHNQFQDYSMYHLNEDAIRALYTMENQSIPDARMPLRISGYEGAAYRNQYNKSEKQGIYPVISLVLNWGEKLWNTATTIKELLDYPVPEGAEECFNDCRSKVFDMRHLTADVREKFQGDVRIILDYLHDKRSMYTNCQKMRHPREVLLMLHALSGDVRYLDMVNTIGEQGGETMCELLDECWNNGVSQGISQRLEQDIKNLMKTMKFTMEQAMDALLVPNEEREMYADMIGVESE